MRLLHAHAHVHAQVSGQAAVAATFLDEHRAGHNSRRKEQQRRKSLAHISTKWGDKKNLIESSESACSKPSCQDSLTRNVIEICLSFRGTLCRKAVCQQLTSLSGKSPLLRSKALEHVHAGRNALNINWDDSHLCIYRICMHVCQPDFPLYSTSI